MWNQVWFALNQGEWKSSKVELKRFPGFQIAFIFPDLYCFGGKYVWGNTGFFRSRMSKNFRLLQLLTSYKKLFYRSLLILFCKSLSLQMIRIVKNFVKNVSLHLLKIPFDFAIFVKAAAYKRISPSENKILWRNSNPFYRKTKTAL